MSRDEFVDEVDIRTVRFTISKINPCFSCGRPIEATMAEVRSGKIAPSALPAITVMRDKQGNLYSLNNRRLFMFKALVEEEAMNPKLHVRVKGVPATKRLGGKYTPERCSLTASVVVGGATRAAKAAAVTALEDDDD